MGYDDLDQLPEIVQRESADDDLSGDDDLVALADPALGVVETPAGRVVVVWGPAGAPGRTTVAVSLAAVLARRSRRTTLVDADPYGGSVAQHLGILDEVSGLLSAARLAADGTLRRHAWIQGLGYGQQGVWAERMGSDLLVAWGFEDAEANGHFFAWVDPASGKPRYPAVKLAAGLDPDTTFTAMPDGSVAWAHVDGSDARKVTVYQARPAGGTP